MILFNLCEAFLPKQFYMLNTVCIMLRTRVNVYTGDTVESRTCS